MPRFLGNLALVFAFFVTSVNAQSLVQGINFDGRWHSFPLTELHHQIVFPNENQVRVEVKACWKSGNNFTLYNGTTDQANSVTVEIGSCGKFCGTSGFMLERAGLGASSEVRVRASRTDSCAVSAPVIVN